MKDFFPFELDPERIAKHPIEPRDHCRMLVTQRGQSDFSDQQFYQVIDYLKPGDCLVINNSKVIPARLYGHKKSGQVFEILLTQPLGDQDWKALIRNKRKCRLGDQFFFETGGSATLKKTSKEEREVVLNFTCPDSAAFFEWLDQTGKLPLPPYFNREDTDQDRIDYQTVYAEDRGSVAAPTAGLHFTESLLQQLHDKGIKIAPITLHVGLGTFLPVTEEAIQSQTLHSETYEIPESSLKIIEETRGIGNSVIAVGTTSVRTLESYGKTEKTKGQTNLFIQQEFPFQIVDGLITNFHLPDSSLVHLVSAFHSKSALLKQYRWAQEQKYRFYSYGDAMLILPAML